MKHEFKAIAINPFDGWMFGSLLRTVDRTTEEETFYIVPEYGQKTKVDPETICRKIYEYEGVKYFANDIVEYNYEGLRRIEPIIDTVINSYVGRSQNEYASTILCRSSFEVKVIGNMAENADLLKEKWLPIENKEVDKVCSNCTHIIGEECGLHGREVYHDSTCEQFCPE